MRERGNEAALDLVELRPVRNLTWETNESGGVILFVPKFRKSLLVRWLPAKIAGSKFRVRLDAYGSFAWNQCDGSSTVHEIARRMEEKFNQPADSLVDRVGLFVRNLLRDKFLLIGNVTSP